MRKILNMAECKNILYLLGLVIGVAVSLPTGAGMLSPCKEMDIVSIFQRNTENTKIVKTPKGA